MFISNVYIHIGLICWNSDLYLEHILTKCYESFSKYGTIA